MSIMCGLNMVAAAAVETVTEASQVAVEVVENTATAVNNAVQTVANAAVPVINTVAVGSNVQNISLTDVTAPIISLINTILTAAIPLVAAAGSLYCVLLGVKYARAEEPQDREKAKQHLKSAIIGFVLIFVLIVALRIATPILTEWMNANSKAIQ